MSKKKQHTAGADATPATGKDTSEADSAAVSRDEEPSTPEGGGWPNPDGPWPGPTGGGDDDAARESRGGESPTPEGGWVDPSRGTPQPDDAGTN